MKVAFSKMSLQEKGGLEKTFFRLVTSFKEAGCEVCCLSADNQRNSQLKDIDVIQVSKPKGPGFYKLLRFDQDCKKWLKNSPVDIVFGIDRTSVQTHYRAGNGVHAVYLKRRQLTDPFLKQLSFHINPLHQTILHLEKKGFESPSLRFLFTNSSMVKNEILSHYNVHTSKIHVVHNGVEWEQWQEPFDESLNQPRSDFHFLFAGHGFRRKGLEFLLKGFALLNERDTFLSIVGKDKELPFFQKLGKKLGLDKQIHFFGAQPSLIPFYQKADALVLPSIYDPFANVTVEALAMGLYVVTSPFNGGKEVLQQETGTIISDIQTPESVCHALKKALAYPKTAQTAKKIRNSIQHLDFSHQLNKIIQLSLS